MIRLALALAFLGLAVSVALAQTGGPAQCGPTTVGITASAIAYPASGTKGPTAPTSYVSIANPNSSGYFCVNSLGGTAATSGTGCAAGSFYVGALSSPLTWAQPSYAPPFSISIIGSAGNMALTCAYN